MDSANSRTPCAISIYYNPPVLSSIPLTSVRRVFARVLRLPSESCRAPFYEVPHIVSLLHSHKLSAGPPSYLELIYIFFFSSNIFFFFFSNPISLSPIFTCCPQWPLPLLTGVFVIIPFSFPYHQVFPLNCYYRIVTLSNTLDSILYPFFFLVTECCLSHSHT